MIRQWCLAAQFLFAVGLTALASSRSDASDIFLDDFDGTALGPAWVANANGGTITVADGILTVSSDAAGFPYIRNVQSLIPAGDFVLSFRMKYNTATRSGTGVGWTNGLQPNGSGDCYAAPGLSVWQDTYYGYNFVTATTDRCAQSTNPLSSPLAWHIYTFERVGTFYQFFVDDFLAWSGSQPNGFAGPLDVWLGNYVVAAAPWTSFSVDYVHVNSLDTEPCSLKLCAQANEGGVATVSCPAGYTITAIDFASYGTPQGACGQFSYGGCNAANSQAIVEAAALGKSSFSVTASNAVFGDPCPGTAKRLYIRLTCSRAPATITATAGSGGSISPGTANVACGSAQAFTIAPANCYSIAAVLVDGVSVGAVPSYTFQNVTANHTIAASFVLGNPPVTRLDQCDGTWGSDTYAAIAGETVCRWGCAMTSLTVALNLAGGALDPGSLNTFMISHPGDYTGKSKDLVNFERTVRDVSDRRLKFVARSWKQLEPLEADLCKGHPEIVGVSFTIIKGKRVPSHWVLATGVSNGHVQIADPLSSSRTTLDYYGNNFVARGYVDNAPPQSLVAQHLAAPVAMAAGLDELDLTLDEGELLVSNAGGQQTGYNPGSQTDLEGIPESAFNRDALANDVDSGAPLDTVESIQIRNTVDGTYAAVVSGLRTGHYDLSIQAFAPDGTSQPPISLSGDLEPGSVDTLVFRVSSGTVDVASTGSRERLWLSRPSPNPALSRSTVWYSLPKAVAVDLAIFAINGRRVRTLEHGAVSAGVHRWVWDGRDDHGLSVQSGMFYVKLRAGDESVARSLILLH